MFDEFYKVNSKPVVIEEIEELDIPQPKPKPRQILKRKASLLLLEWYEDPEFEEYMKTSLEKQCKILRGEELESMTEDLGSKFDGTADCVNVHGVENEEALCSYLTTYLMHYFLAIQLHSKYTRYK